MQRTGLFREKAETGPASGVVDGSIQYLAVALPSREHAAYGEMLDWVKANGFTLEPSNRKWWLRDRHKVLGLLADSMEDLRDRWQCTFTTNFESRTADVRWAGCEVSAKEAEGNSYDVEVSWTAPGVEEERLRKALAGGEKYVQTGKRILLIGSDHKRRAERLRERLGVRESMSVGGSRSRISRAEAVSLEEDISELVPGWQPPAAWARATAGLRSVAALREAPVDARLNERLRGYQRWGVAWMHHLLGHGFGGILADEMGLGKTVQALGLISTLHASPSKSVCGPALVICPASLLENWRRETTRFLPGLRVFVHHGSNRLERTEDFAGTDVVITSYGTLANDRAVFAKQSFALAIGDEAQHLKNRNTAPAKSLKLLQCEGRFLLTGTPIENAASDLVSLFEFLMPGFLRPVPRPDEAVRRQWLTQAAPFVLRRTKRDVAPELPEKIEVVRYCRMSGAQERLYRRFEDKAKASLGAGGIEVFAHLTRMRQIAAEPSLLDPALGDADSSKWEAFREILDEALDDGHRILVFSQFVRVLQKLAERLEAEGLPYQYLDGSTRDRQARVDRFNSDAEIPVFLISLKAGGTGLNLTGADTVVLYDPWWNPAVERQAIDRAHRIGQDRKVTAIRLIASGTVEERVQRLAEEKAGELDALFRETESSRKSLNRELLGELLADSG